MLNLKIKKSENRDSHTFHKVEYQLVIKKPTGNLTLYIIPINIGLFSQPVLLKPLDSVVKAILNQ
jgi:hypothetical protein